MWVIYPSVVLESRNLRIPKLSTRDYKSLNKAFHYRKGEKPIIFHVSDTQPGKFYKIYKRNKVKMNQLSKDFWQ